MYRVPRKQDKAYEVQDIYGVALSGGDAESMDCVVCMSAPNVLDTETRIPCRV